MVRATTSNGKIYTLTFLSEVKYGLGKRIETANPANIPAYFKVILTLLSCPSNF
jgi:hypothetical protein